MVIGVIWRQICVSMIRERVIYLFWLGKGSTSEAGKYLFRVVNVGWRCVQYFVIVSCS